jgi:hypothetical protein
MLLYGYIVVSLAVGVMSNFVKARWTVLASALVIFGGIVSDSWRWIDWHNESLGRAVWRIVTQGTFWYLIPSTLFFIVAFLVGRYGYQLVLKTVR